MNSGKRFQIALSFPGERRAYVAQVAERLAETLGREHVLYDQWHEAEFARPDLDTYLQDLYHDQSELIAVFLCADYERKDWCGGVEWRAVKDLIKRREGAAIMPLRFDTTAIPGLFSTDGYVWLGDDRDPAEIARLIIQRWQLNGGVPPSTLDPRGVTPPRIDLSHLPAGAEHFLGRGPELAALDAAWADGDGAPSGTSVVELIAPGGTGKTALVKRWLDNLRTGQSVSVSKSGSKSGSESVSVSGSGSIPIPIPIPTATATPTPQENQPWRGASQIFAWSFYSEGTGDDRQASEDLFLAEAIERFSIDIDPAANPADKGRVLAEALIAARTLLILDGLEPLQYPSGPLAGELRAPSLKALLTQLAAVGHPGLCVVTSREWLQDLAEWVRAPDHRQTGHPGGSVLRIDLGNLGDTDGAALLHARGANRAGAAAIGPHDPELIAASQAVQGHALTLSLLGGYLALAHEGDIRRRDQVDLGDADAELSSGHVRRVMAAYETWFARAGETHARELAALRLFGLFDRPASAALLETLRAAPPIPGLTEALFTGTADVSPDGTADVSSATARSGVGASDFRWSWTRNDTRVF